MLVRITDIPDRGLELNETLDLASLNQRMQEGSNQGITFTAPPKVVLTINRTGQGAESRGTISAEFLQDCSLCDDPIPRTVTTRADIVFEPRPPEAAPDDPDYFDDVGISYFSGDNVDLELILQETLILAMSIYWHPEQDATEKCTLCGKRCTFNLEEKADGVTPNTAKGQSLGDLLKSAQNKKKSYND